jgi:hypothetical protein
MPKTLEYGNLIWILRIYKPELTEGETKFQGSSWLQGLCSDPEIISKINKKKI